MNGMADNEDDDVFFDDDDFPDIPDDELNELEQNAITFTQQERLLSTQQGHAAAQKNQSLIPRSNLSRSIVNNAASTGNGQFHGRASLDATTIHTAHDSSVGTILDEDGLPLVVEERPVVGHQKQFDETAQREQWRASRYGQPQTRALAKSKPTAPTLRQQRPQTSRNHSHITDYDLPGRQLSGSLLHRSVEEEALRARISELMRERDDLTTNLHAAKDEISIRNGEIANIRARQLNEEKAHQRQLGNLQKLKLEESEKHSVSLQAIHAENARVAAEVQFLKHELKEESRKAQNYQRQLQERPSTEKPGNVNTTPKRSHALRDGFDDDEMVVISPVKSGRKSKPGTPTANRKRKQPTGNNTYVQPLPLRLSGAATGVGIGADTGVVAGDESAVEPSIAPQKTTVTIRKDHMTKRHLRLIQRVTSFRPFGRQEILIQHLFKLSFPSNTRKDFGSIFSDAVAKLEGPRLPLDLIQIFIDLWSKALQEDYYTCLPLLTEAISFVIDQDPLVINATLLHSILPLLQSTIEINGSARFKLMKRDYLNNAAEPKPTINPDIDNTTCMELLHTVAVLISDESELIGLFWRSISTDFVLMMTNACQPIPEITLMLQTLTTSIFPETFGNICEASQQSRFESHICDRVCFLLWQLPKPDANKMPYSQEQICCLRQESLNFLTQLTLGSASNPFDPSTANNHGTRFVVSNPNAISRLVRSVYDELAVAYNMTPSQHLHIRLVNTAVRIIHFVLFSPAGRQIDWQSKINGSIGAAHKFRVVMGRLACAEGTKPGIDAGITVDTIKMAIELIEEIVTTPDEAENLLKIFEESGNGSRRTSAIGSTQRS